MTTSKPITRAAAAPEEAPIDQGSRRLVKVSITMPEMAVEAARERVGGRGLSSYVAAAVEQQLRRDALRDWVREMDAEHGPVPAEDLAAARELLLGRSG